MHAIRGQEPELPSFNSVPETLHFGGSESQQTREAPRMVKVSMNSGRWALALIALTAACAASDYVDLTPENIRAIQPAAADPRAAQVQLAPVRAGYTATVLPDGKIIVLGGAVAGSGAGASQIFNPATGAVEASAGLPQVSTSGHTATLLQDGEVLVVGGRDAHAVVSDAFLWNPYSHAVTRIPGLEHARADHHATLLPSGAVLVWGGVGADGAALRFAEVFDPASAQFVRFDADQRRSLPTKPIEEREPVAESVKLASTASKLDFRPVVLFSKPMAANTLNERTVTLVGPHGPVPMTSTVAGGGMLLFVKPQTPLAPGTDYTVFVRGASDADKHQLAFASLHFATPRIAAGDAGNGLFPPPSGALPSATAVAAVQAAVPEYVDVSKLRWKAAAPAQDDELWIPGPQHFSGHWWNELPKVASVTLPQARAGVTALAGRVLRMNGRPLADVTLSIAGVEAVTDARGVFLLAGIPAGTSRMDIDGTTASRGNSSYGNYAVRVEVKARETTALPYLIWMPKLDPQGTVRIPSPTVSETVVSTPSIPGLELHIPANTVIRDRTGNVVTELNITAIPTNQPPFPLPDLGVPVYFTIQPGGATIEGFAPEERGARLFYPNFRREVPGARGAFWNYDANERGWFIYGLGTISQDARQAIPDPGVVITELTGAMFNGGGTPPYDAGEVSCDGGGDDNNKGNPTAGWPGSYECGDPLNALSRQFTRSETDLFLPDVIPISVTRTYRSFDVNQRMFGIGFVLNYDMFFHSANQYQETDLILPSGKKVHFVRTSPGTSWTDAVFTTKAPGRWYGAVVAWNGGGWNLTFKDGWVWTFPDNAPIQQMKDRHGNKLVFTRAGGSTAPITRIDSPNGRWVEFTLDSSGRVTAAKDSAGRTVTYQYDTSGQLTQVTNANQELQATYGFNSRHVMTMVRSGKGDPIVQNVYDCPNIQQVAIQILGDGSRFTFNPLPICPTYLGGGSDPTTPSYGSSFPMPTTSSPTAPTVTEFTDRSGQTRHVEFDADGRITKDVYPKGTPDERTFLFAYVGDTKLISSVTDPLNRTTSYTYDADGNITSVTKMSGTASAVTYTYAYNGSRQLTHVTDPLQHSSTLVYNAFGNLAEARDPLDRVTQLGYDAQGRVTSFTNALQQTTRLTHSGPDLASVTDPLDRTTRFLHDAAGRTRATINALGQNTTYNYDHVGRLKEVDDPTGNATRFGYDVNGNMVSSTDQRNNTTTYGYDPMNRRTSRTDPLNATESLTYTPAGLVDSFTARNGRITRATYDTAGRLASVGFGATAQAPESFESTISYSYDRADRVFALVDSASGEIDYTYDDFDRMVQEATQLGTVQYGYDAVGRRTQARPTQQQAIDYAYDGADRLIELGNAGDTVRIAYDDLDRYSSMQLRNGVTQDYAYDAAGHLTAITYRTLAAALGNLTYDYDALGRLVHVGGTLARVNLPSVMGIRSFNANNQIEIPGYTYDANGQMTSDGASTYSWDARGQLIQISGAVSARFAYDVLGRRIRKSINDAAKQYLYDGPNLIQELGDGLSPAINVSYLTGLNLDESFGGTDGTTRSDYTTDRQGSRLGVLDTSGNASTNVSYDPFGAATTTGVQDANAARFTGRENDETGLVYLRARYYDPRSGAFVSEDPFGLRGGLANLYSYVGGDPINHIDPSGHIGLLILPPGPPPPWTWPIIGGVVGGAVVGAVGAGAGTLALPGGGTLAGGFGGAVKGAGIGAAIGAAAAAGAMAADWTPPPFYPGWRPPPDTRETSCRTGQPSSPEPVGPDPDNTDFCVKTFDKCLRSGINHGVCLAGFLVCVTLSAFGGG